jgi:hypothetical protein
MTRTLLLWVSTGGLWFMAIAFSLRWLQVALLAILPLVVVLPVMVAPLVRRLSRQHELPDVLVIGAAALLMAPLGAWPYLAQSGALGRLIQGDAAPFLSAFASLLHPLGALFALSYGAAGGLAARFICSREPRDPGP